MFAAIVNIVLVVPALFFLFVAAYLVITTLSAFRYVKPGGAAEPLRIAVLMPAHNEAGQIAHTVGNVLAASDAGVPVSVFVIADNCEDATATLAREAGAEAFERADTENRGKGQALDWCLRTHADRFEAYDIILLLDADVAVDATYFVEVARDFSDPSVEVVQTYYGVANVGDNWRTALTYAGFCLMNHVRPAGRCRLGGTAGLKGTGMAFRREVLLRYGWPAHSIVEDIEFGTLLLRDGVRVQYDPAARHVSDMPATRSQAESQRRRWEAGRIQVIGAYVPGLLRNALSMGRWDYLDAALDLAVPPLSLLVLGQGALLVGAALFHSPVAWLLVATCAGTVFHVIAGLVYSRAPGRVYLYLLSAPLFLLWKIPLYVRIALSRGQQAWVRTAREGEINRDERP